MTRLCSPLLCEEPEKTDIRNCGQLPISFPPLGSELDGIVSGVYSQVVEKVFPMAKFKTGWSPYKREGKTTGPFRRCTEVGKRDV